LIVSCCLT